MAGFANLSAGFSEMLKIQYLDPSSIPVISTNDDCPGITPGHLLCIDYAIIKRKAKIWTSGRKQNETIHCRRVYKYTFCRESGCGLCHGKLAVSEIVAEL